ncbi:hypothetical protein [Enterovibrio norvegicus]|uniref:hypothetical protein n=1 Tax=Enterovibrio norvegicus TaxID=188144 RepID=UPI00354F563D
MTIENQTDLENQPTTEEQAALLEQFGAFDAEQAGEPTEQEKAEGEAEQAELEQAEAAAMAAELAPMTAYMGLSAIEMAIQGFVHPRFTIPDGRREEVVRECAPILVKYGALVPHWLAQYEPEIRAVKALGGLTMESIGQVRELKAEDAKAIDAKKAANDDQTDAEAA